jgi:Na+-transporting methylmalonyl-CoA/oxaloacetate decarboxylase gamma subunit
MESLREGLLVSALGIGLVFAVLALLAGLVAALAGLDARQPPVALASPHPGPDHDTLAAVAVAVRLHLRALRRQAAPVARVHSPGALPSRWVSTGRTRQNRSFTPRGRYT